MNDPSKRQVFLDTETTGLNWKSGDRIIELAAIEVIGTERTSRKLHHFFNPQRRISDDAIAIHGITDKMLTSKPLFADCIDEIVEFIQDSELIIHNAPFDLGFLDNEFRLAGSTNEIAQICNEITDSLEVAKRLHPGRPNNLNQLCERYGIDTSARTKHNALLDTSMLVDVYLAMTFKASMQLFSGDEVRRKSIAVDPMNIVQRQNKIVVKASPAEFEAHRVYIAEINASKQESPIAESTEPQSNP